MSKIKVESGVSMPKDPRNWNIKYPFDQMKVGDSFQIPSDCSVVSVRLSAGYHGKVNGKKFSCQKMDDGTHRLFRIE